MSQGQQDEVELRVHDFHNLSEAFTKLSAEQNSKLTRIMEQLEELKMARNEATGNLSLFNY
jgi:ACT domain-containing protein